MAALKTVSLDAKASKLRRKQRKEFKQFDGDEILGVYCKALLLQASIKIIQVIMIKVK